MVSGAYILYYNMHIILWDKSVFADWSLRDRREIPFSIRVIRRLYSFYFHILFFRDVLRVGFLSTIVVTLAENVYEYQREL